MGFHLERGNAQVASNATVGNGSQIHIRKKQERWTCRTIMFPDAPSDFIHFKANTCAMQSTAHRESLLERCWSVAWHANLQLCNVSPHTSWPWLLRKSVAPALEHISFPKLRAARYKLRQLHLPGRTSNWSRR